MKKWHERIGHLTRTLLWCFVGFTTTHAVESKDWPNWRGPNNDRIAVHTGAFNFAGFAPQTQNANCKTQTVQPPIFSFLNFYFYHGMKGLKQRGDL